MLPKKLNLQFSNRAHIYSTTEEDPALNSQEKASTLTEEAFSSSVDKDYLQKPIKIGNPPSNFKGYLDMVKRSIASVPMPTKSVPLSKKDDKTEWRAKISEEKAKTLQEQSH